MQSTCIETVTQGINNACVLYYSKRSQIEHGDFRLKMSDHINTSRMAYRWLREFAAFALNNNLFFNRLIQYSLNETRGGFFLFKCSLKNAKL